MADNAPVACAARSNVPKLQNMEVTEIVSALVVIGLSAHMTMQHRLGINHERWESARRRLGSLGGKETALQSRDYSRLFVPVGLRIDQARRVIREANEESQGSPTG